MKKVLSVIFAAVSCITAFAQGNSAMPFSVIPRDARTLSMGGTSALKTVPVWALGSETLDIDAAYALWAPETGSKSSNIDFNMLGKIGGKFAFGFTGAYIMGEPYDSSFKPADMALGLGLGYKILSNLSFGVNVSYLKSSLASDVALSAVSADAIVAATLGDFKLAGGITSLGSDVVAESGARFSLPTALMLLGSYSLSDGKKSEVDFGAQMDYFFSDGFRLGLGAEYTYNKLLSARVGYNYGGKSVLPSFVSLGAGVCFSGLKINLTYLTLSDTVGGSLMAGVGYAF